MAAAQAAQPLADEVARRDGNGATGDGDTGDVGGDVGGMEASKLAIQKTMRRLKRVRGAARAMIKALDISHGFNDGPSSDSGLAGPGGSALGSGRKKLTKAERKALRKMGKAFYRDQVVDGANGSGSVTARDLNGMMYHAARGLRDALTAANRNMRMIRGVARMAGLDLSTLPDPPGPGSKRDGEGVVVGADAGANAQALADLDLATRALEVERMR